MFKGSERSTAEKQSEQGERGELPVAVHYALTILLVATATLLAYAGSAVVPAPGLTLIFVLPVVIAGTAFGFGPSIAATLIGVLAFDFFFTQPYYTLRMSDPSEIWAALLLLVTAAIVSTVSWQSGQYAAEARRAAAQAEELRRLAQAVVHGDTRGQIEQAAATALSRIFAGPAVILSQTAHGVQIASAAGGAQMSADDLQAAEGALASKVHMRGETFPHTQSKFDMWPVLVAEDRQYVAGVDFGSAEYERPANADRIVEIVAGYLATMRGVS